MLRKEPQLINFLSQNSHKLTNYNISRLEFIRKKKCETVNQKSCFSNDLLKQNIRKHKGCDQVIQLKLHNEYSPRKGSTSVKISAKKLQKTNPYKQAVQKMKNYEQKMLSSLQKSFNISKKLFSDHRDHCSIKQSNFLLSRSKTALSLQDLRSDLNKNMNNYENIVMVNPQPIERERMIQSAIIEKSKRTRIKTISVLSNYTVQKSSSEPKIFS